MNTKKSKYVPYASYLFATITLVANAHGQNYVVTDLGTISGPLSNAKNINDNGDVAGLSMVASSNFHAGVWNPGVVDVGVINADTQSIAYAINNNGAVTGVSYNFGDLQPHAFLWLAGTLTPLGDFSPHDINDVGSIVGHRTFFSPENLLVEQACRWSNGALSDLPTLGGRNCQAFAINAASDAVGQSFIANNLTLRACLWIGNTAIDLGTLSNAAAAKSSALDINNARQIVGWSDTTNGPAHAFRYDVNAAGQITSRVDLGALNGSASIAFGINDDGVIIGASDYRGCIWENGTLTDLNDLIPPNDGWTITRAVAINNNGVIAADGVRLGFTHAVILTPVDCLKGDINADTRINGRDIEAMVQTLLGGGGQFEQCAGDLHLPYDGAATLEDLPEFVQCILGESCI